MSSFVRPLDGVTVAEFRAALTGFSLSAVPPDGVPAGVPLMSSFFASDSRGTQRVLLAGETVLIASNDSNLMLGVSIASADNGFSLDGFIGGSVGDFGATAYPVFAPFGFAVSQILYPSEELWFRPSAPRTIQFSQFIL